jgi:hypothetical protein
VYRQVTQGKGELTVVDADHLIGILEVHLIAGRGVVAIGGSGGSGIGRSSGCWRRGADVVNGRVVLVLLEVLLLLLTGMDGGRAFHQRLLFLGWTLSGRVRSVQSYPLEQTEMQLLSPRARRAVAEIEGGWRRPRERRGKETSALGGA